MKNNKSFLESYLRMKQYVIIVAGGNGSRMNSAVPKQFMLLKNRPVLMHTIERFIQFNPTIEIVLVLPNDQFDTWKELCIEYDFTAEHKLVLGGKERFWSVQNGLDAVDEGGIVFIHDGVRPLVSLETIQRCLDKTLEKGNAVPVLPVVESLRQVEDEKNQMADRTRFVTIQTPQVFKTEEIKAAYHMGFDPSFTDDTSVLERLGKKINLVEGNRENIKITHPVDLKFAEAMLK